MIQTTYRTIKTEIPNSDDLELIKKLDDLEPRSSHHNLPLVWNRAEDFSVYDRFGNRFIDFSSGIFVTNTGHRKNICNINTEDISEVSYSYSFPTEIKLKFLEKLVKFTGFDKAFLLSSGTEAVEAAIKIMRLAKGKKGILSFKGAMHGKSGLAENLRGLNYDWITRDTWIEHLDYFNGHCGVSFNDDIKNLSNTKEFTSNHNDLVGVIIESYRGWDASFYDKKYIQDLTKWAKDNGILVAFDEIQGGFFRTGKLFAYQHYNSHNFQIEPDLVCVGKALGNGVPISAVLGKREIFDKAEEKSYDFSSTYSGNPLSCCLALANLDYMENNNLIEEAERKSKILEKIFEFQKYDIVERVNYRGLVGAIIFNNKEIADEVCMRCLKNGLILVKTGRESIKMGPPLTIDDGALIEGIEVLKDVIENYN